MSRFLVAFALMMLGPVLPAFAVPAGGCLGDSLVTGGCEANATTDLAAPAQPWPSDPASFLVAAPSDVDDDTAMALASDHLPLRAGRDIVLLDAGIDGGAFVLAGLAELRSPMILDMPDLPSAAFVSPEGDALRGGGSMGGIAGGGIARAEPSPERSAPTGILAHLDSRVVTAVAGAGFVLVLWLAFYFTESAVLVHSRYQPHAAAKPDGSAPALLMCDYTECTYLVWNGLVRVTKQGRFYPTWTNMKYIKAFMDVEDAGVRPPQGAA